MNALFPPPPSDAEIDRLLEHVVRAPSVLNTRPWRFVVDQGAVHIHADRSRQLLALDPDGRDLTVSCGAALFYLRTAARHAGWASFVEVLPEPGDPDWLATVRFVPEPPHADDHLFRALSVRHTHRHPFNDAAIPADVVREMVEAASVEGARLDVLTEWKDRVGVARLVEEGVAIQGFDPAVADDLRAWLRSDTDPRPDGIRDAVQGEWDRRSDLRTPLAAVAVHKSDLARAAPALGVVATEADGPADWLTAGGAMAHALVAAASRGVSASFINQPVEVESLRARLAGRLGGGFPQVAFRLGYPGNETGASRPPALPAIEDSR